MTHTKEPWKTTDFKQGGKVYDPYSGWFKLGGDDFDRAQACVNALAGVDDPEHEVRALRERVDYQGAEIEALRRVAAAAREYRADEGFDTAEALRSALSALEPSEEWPLARRVATWHSGECPGCPDCSPESESAWRERAGQGGA